MIFLQQKQLFNFIQKSRALWVVISINIVVNEWVRDICLLNAEYYI